MELRAKPNNVFQKDFFKLMNDSVSGKTVENVENHKDLKLITTDSRISHLMLEQNYHTKKCFSKNLLPLEMNKTKIKIGQASVSRSIPSRHQKNSDVSVLVWLRKTRVWGQDKTKLHRHRQRYSSCNMKTFLLTLQELLWQDLIHQTMQLKGYLQVLFNLATCSN